ncbi:MAG: class I SAM-dependent DNA methyltransferase [Candidatus Promineifilaceae bacterium]
MLAPRLRNRVFDLWTKFWSSGMSNPLVAVEQITYLLFLNQLEKMDKERVAQGKTSIYEGSTTIEKEVETEAEDGKKIKTKRREEVSYETCRWSYIVKDPSYDHIQDVVFPWLRQIDYILYPPEAEAEGEQPPRYLEDAAFQLDRNKQALLQESINIINELFGSATSANADLMGDIFEYLLSEIQSSGKNGQFRTPRHIIRFMIELLDPEKNKPIMDPAAGTAGYLINSVLHLKKKATDPQTMRVEWDGSPHRLKGELDLNIEQSLQGEFFEGYDNDRTMVRIAWMNMVLHGIERPRIFRGDSLSKQFRPLLENKKYKYILANPPFTGTVDEADLHEVLKRKGTNKSELLFIWLILELLELDGRAAIVVPEGVLFGSTNAHKELRRTLLLENAVDAIISLPSGVFQPYTGVKTSIILLRKRGELPTDHQPQTPLVWFYEIAADGYSLDAKREPQPWAENDLWDGLHKYHELNKPDEDFNYYQPRIYEERWREVDADFLKIFPELDETLGHEKGQALSIAERFVLEVQAQAIPTAPQPFTAYVGTAYGPAVINSYKSYVAEGIGPAAEAARPKQGTTAQYKMVREALHKRLRDIKGLFNEARKELLEAEQDQSKRALNAYGYAALKPYLEQGEAETRALIEGWVEAIVTGLGQNVLPQLDEADRIPTDKQAVRQWVRQFAKLDGYDVQLQDATQPPQPVPPPPAPEGEKPRSQPLLESKCWATPVRVWAQDDAWELKDDTGQVVWQGSHDENGQVRPEYVRAYMSEGKPTNTDLLEPDCIEANEYNLSAGRYKPFTLQAVSYDPPADIIRALQTMEANIQAGLARLLAKVEGIE